VTEKTILVTGISGFIAKHCAVELLRHGYAVRGTVRSTAKGEETRTTLARHCDTSRLSFAVRTSQNPMSSLLTDGAVSARH
jgi:dihydroflavonol-4-reductase